VSDKLISKHVH